MRVFMMYKLSFSKIFDEDIKSVLDYIDNEYDSNIVKESLLLSIRRKAMNIKKMPYAYPLLRNKILSELGYRTIQVKNYLLFYSIDEKKNIIVLERFLHGSRDWAKLIQNDLETN